ncbi:MAG: hypothetical protein ACFN29_05065 [Veillonella sp.]
MRAIDNHIVLLLIMKRDNPARIKIQAKQKRRLYFPSIGGNKDGRIALNTPVVLIVT